MNKERLYKIILAPVVSEKTTMAAESSNQVAFKVLANASKLEIGAAVEEVFGVTVENVRVMNVKGKTKRTRFGVGRRSDWKKAYVRLAAGQEIDLAVAD